MHYLKILNSTSYQRLFMSLVFSLLSQFLFSKGNIIIVCYDSENFQSSNLESLSKAILETSKKRLNNIGIYHYVNPKFSLSQKDFIDGKCKVTYKSLFLSCDIELCTSLEQDFTRFSGNLNKVIVCGELSCVGPKKWNAETIYYPNVDAEKIAEKISLELKLNKKSEVNYFIVIPGNSSKIPSARFDSDIVEINTGVAFKLSPVYNNKENIKEYLWTSTEKIDNPALESPTITATKNTDVTLKITDSRGCPHVFTLKLAIKKSRNTEKEMPNENTNECECNSNIAILKMLSENELNRVFKKNNFIEFINKGTESNWGGIKISQNKSSSAEKTFDIPFRLLNDCISEFKVKIADTKMKSQINLDTKNAWEEIYKMDEIMSDNRKYEKDGFVTFTLDLTSIKGLDAGTSYILIIEGYDATDNQCMTFKSNDLRFVPCSSKE